MDCREKALRVGLSAVLCAVILRLFAGGLAGRAAAFLARPEMRAFLFYLETGRDVRSSLSEDAMVFSPESPEPVNPSPPPTEPETSAPEQAAGWPPAPRRRFPRASFQGIARLRTFSCSHPIDLNRRSHAEHICGNIYE